MNNDEEMHYLWTIQPHLAKEGIHILVEFEPIQQQNIPSTNDKNTTTLPEHITAVTQIARDAYGPYFTRVVQKSLTLPTNRMISHAELVRKILKYRAMDANLWTVRMTMRVSSFYEEHLISNDRLFQLHMTNTINMMEHVTAITQMASDEPSMLYPTVNDDDNEIDYK
ncbi:hypothetical protein M9H77_27595 [Catharanthus roseus]|uniref:Uncharacterized protein n=1 Tax=Catharanthus roseus TaxID=4058 RepID=A0ACC0AFM7_CATRO|nr:hypothetical protein M9H77_27595 [Catharanthus roseus]